MVRVETVFFGDPLQIGFMVVGKTRFMRLMVGWMEELDLWLSSEFWIADKARDELLGHLITGRLVLSR